jgi:hypothetical protein
MASNEIEILDSAATVEKVKKNAAGRALDRRHFIAALGMTGAAAGAGLMSGCSTTNSVAVSTSTTPAQTDVLNFVLNIKLLLATFYSFVTQGADLTGAAVTNSGSVTGGTAKLVFTGTNAAQITDMLNEIYYDEKNHVTTLISLLGSAVVFRPAINLAAYATINATNALSIARMLEDVAVTALAGANASLSTSDVTLVGQIIGADSFHSGALRLVSIQNPGIAAYAKADSLDVPPFDLGTAVLEAAGPTAAGGFFATAGAATASSTNPAGFAFARSTSQALSITYASGGVLAASGATSGGFFPNGVNGNIKKV